ncbi:MAG: tRNA epoxyqueuosine(34) reductase QueG, partial [Planctomycetes bacterium]|nr:tRNA epoxyqueuosine(34) reductase QueG [Planctomycetota bacterium]
MEDAIRARALELGFSQVGFCRAAGPLEPPGRLEDWLGAGLHAGMSYLQRAPDERRDARSLLPEAKAIVAVAAAYAPAAASSPIASYALQQDYHRALAERLEELLAFIHSLHPGARGLVCVDSKPLLERRAAALAGLGWIGKNTMVMNAADGPWLLLGELIVSVDLAPDAPQESRCGACRACLDACPTGALAAPFVLDARRCLSYWTIEHRGPAPEWVREAQGTRLFGCDECLAACPFGRAALCE